MSRCLSQSLRVAVLASLLIPVVSAARLRAQEESYKRFLDIVESKYVPPDGVGKQSLKLKLNLSPDLPDDAKIVLELNHNGLPIDGLKGLYVVKGRKRLGVVFNWELDKRVGPDDYQLQVTLNLEDQEDSVRAKFKKKSKVFPARLNPFTYPIFDAGKEIKIGTDAERAAQAQQMCKIYDDFINELLDNWSDFNGSVKKLRAGEKFHKGGSPDQKAYTRFIREWRRKQGKTQRAIRQDFFQKYPTILNKTRTAHANLLRLSQMVSKRAYTLQKDAEKEVGLKHVNPAPDPKQKKDVDLPYFDRNYRYKVTTDTLNRTMDTIVRLVCPEAETGDEDAGSSAGATPEAEKAKKPGS